MNHTPCIGIIIPIYNVEKYLKECLDSVINQTYKKLQIVLIDDGSTDGSFAIAKEYFDKDKRIALIKKEKNTGMGSSRNVGLDYVKQSLVKGAKGGGGDLEVFEHQSPLAVEYIHFLDSDDWLELSCIEECVNSALASGADIIWHGCNHFQETTQQTTESNLLKSLNLKEKRNYTGLEIFSILPSPSFSWVAMGIIKSWLANKVRFEEGIESEDALFGMQIFSLAKCIQIILKPFYYYRIRPNSISQHTLNNTINLKEICFPSHQSDLIDTLNNSYEIRHYSFAYSCAVISLRMDEFLKKEVLCDQLNTILKNMIEERAIYAFGGCGFDKDPRNIRGLCEKLIHYTSKVPWNLKLAYYYPKIYKILKKIKNILKNHNL